MNEEIINEVMELNPDAVCITGFDDCIIGYGRRPGMEVVLAYDVELIIKKLMERDGMSEQDAIEFYEYNIDCAYMGESTPILVKTFHKEGE